MKTTYLQYRGAKVSVDEYNAAVKLRAEERANAHTQHVSYRGAEKDVRTDEVHVAVPHDVLWRGAHATLAY